MIEIMEASAEVLAPANQEKCIKLYAQIAEKNVKSHLSLQKEDQYTAGIACRNTENQGFKFSLNFLFFR
jgi:hypothetical protein